MMELSARATPTKFEIMVASQTCVILRSLRMRDWRRILCSTLPEDLARMRGFISRDHCAICHANDGGGQTTIGKWPVSQAAGSAPAGKRKVLPTGELFWIHPRNGSAVHGNAGVFQNGGEHGGIARQVGSWFTSSATFLTSAVGGNASKWSAIIPRARTTGRKKTAGK